MTSDNFATAPRKVDGPVRSGAPITPSDTVGIDTTRAIYVGVAGDISIRLIDDATPVLFKAVPAGSVLPVRTSLVRATGTTATNLIALY